MTTGWSGRAIHPPSNPSTPSQVSKGTAGSDTSRGKRAVGDCNLEGNIPFGAGPRGSGRSASRSERLGEPPAHETRYRYFARAFFDTINNKKIPPARPKGRRVTVSRGACMTPSPSPSPPAPGPGERSHLGSAGRHSNACTQLAASPRRSMRYSCIEWSLCSVM